MTFNSALEDLSKIPFANKIIFPCDPEEHQFKEEDFKENEFLGKGQSFVYEYTHPNQGKLAVKVMPKLKNRRTRNPENYRHIKKITNEIKILDTLKQNREHIVEFYGFFIGTKNIFIFMELMEFSLENFLNVNRFTLPIEKSDRYKKQIQVFFVTAMSILKALEFCVGQKIRHNDIKPDNILIDRHGRVKLCDFGEATTADSEVFAGSVYYYSPERFKSVSNSSNSDHKMYSDDLWSFGIILMEIIYGDNPVFYFGQVGNSIEEELPRLGNLTSSVNIKFMLKTITIMNKHLLLQGMDKIDEHFIYTFLKRCMIKRNNSSVFSMLNEIIEKYERRKKRHIKRRGFNQNEQISGHAITDINNLFLEYFNYPKRPFNKLKFPGDPKEYHIHVRNFKFQPSKDITKCTELTHIGTNRKLLWKLAGENTQDYHDEVELLSCLSRHPNIVEFYGHGKLGFFTFCIFFEPLAINLFNISSLISSRQEIFPETFLRNIFISLIQALKSIYLSDFCNIKITQENVLFRTDGIVKLSFIGKISSDSVKHLSNVKNLTEIKSNRSKPVYPKVLKILYNQDGDILKDNGETFIKQFLCGFDIWNFGLTLIKVVINNTRDQNKFETILSKLEYECSTMRYDIKALYKISNFMEINKLYKEFKMLIWSLTLYYSEDIVELLLFCMEDDLNDYHPDCEALMKTDFFQRILKTYDKNKILLGQFLINYFSEPYIISENT